MTYANACSARAGLVLLVLAGSVAAQEAASENGIDRAALELALTFEGPHSGAPFGWGGGPADSIFLDRDTVHGGEWAVRIERDGGSRGTFTTVTKQLPLGIEGRAVTLRGFLRTRGVVAWAGLWLREDGDGGVVAFRNMQNDGLAGDTEWARHEISLPLEAKAKRLFFGVLLSGAGAIWADDLELLVDGKPIWEAPVAVTEPTALDRDHEFDAGSGIAIAGELLPEQWEGLVQLGKVWGFLKGHHPRVAQGELHWDYELFRVLPKVLAATEPAAWQQALVEWIDRLGVPTECTPCAAEPVDAQLLPDLGWLHDRERLGPELSARLEAIHRLRSVGPRFFVSFRPGVGNPDFGAEPAYAEIAEPDLGYRLLALYRLWHIIATWFPYRDQIGEPWEAVLREALPSFLQAKDSDAYDLALLRLIARVHDTHANLWSSLAVRPPRGECDAPVQLRFVEGHAVVSAVPESVVPETAGHLLARGDVVRTVDGRSVEELVAEWSPFYAASNEPTRLRDIARFLLRGPCTPAAVSVERAGSPLEVTLEVSVPRVPLGELDPARGMRHDRPGPAFQRLSEEVAYLTLSEIRARDVAGYIEQARGAKGLIVDLRGYPAEFVVFALGRRLVDEPTPFARFTQADHSNPGAFLWGPTVSLEPLEPAFHGKVVVLVDEVSQSQAEYTAMALRASPRALVVGSTTAGADGNVSPIPLPGGRRAMISGIGVFYPDGTPTQRIGIVPDITVEPTIEGIRAGRDEVLERAIREISGP